MPLDARHAAHPGRSSPSHVLRTRPLALALLVGLSLQACALHPATPPAVVMAPSTPPPAPAPVVVPAPVPIAAPASAPSPLAAVLKEADRQRNLGPAELAAELTRLGEPTTSPLQMQLALLLLQTHQPVDTARAVGLLQRVAVNDAPEAVELRALARVLASRALDVRRLEDQLERQGAQLRDAQKRIDALHDRLEAMRAIERSLTAPVPGGSRPLP